MIAELLLGLLLRGPLQEESDQPALPPVQGPEEESQPAAEEIQTAQPEPRADPEGAASGKSATSSGAKPGDQAADQDSKAQNRPELQGSSLEGPRSLSARGTIKPLELKLDHAYDFKEIESALTRIADRAPHLAQLETIGQSAQGAPLLVLTLSDPSGGPAEEKPAILMLDYSPKGVSLGAETALAFVQLLLDEAAAEAQLEKEGKPPGLGFLGLKEATPEDLHQALEEYGQDLTGFLSGSTPRQVLRDFTVIIAPALDPDERDQGPAEAARSGVRYDLNFPLGWRPASLRPGAGDYPFSKPETLALGSYLSERSNLALMLGISSGAGEDAGSGQSQTPWLGAMLPQTDREVFRKLEGIGFLSAQTLARHGDSLRPSEVLAPWASLGSPGGGLFDYAFQRFGIYPVAWSPAPLASDELLSAADHIEHSVRAMALQSVTLLGALPRVRIEQDALVELAPGLWQLDVAVRNSGVLPTLSSLGEKRRVAGDVRLTLGGAKLLATGLRAGDDAAFQVVQLEATGNMVSMGAAILDSGETRWLRLVIEGDKGSTIELVGRAARGGSTRLKISLN